MKCTLWFSCMVLIMASCHMKSSPKDLSIIYDLIKSREENRIIDHKRTLYGLHMEAFGEPYRTMLLMEKKYYFHDTTSFSPDHSYLQYMFDGIKLLERGENKLALMKVDTFFQKLDTTQAIINAFLLPMVYENMATLRIKPEITKRLYNGSDYDKKDKIYHLSEAYGHLLQQEILYNGVEYYKSCALGQHMIAKLLTSKEYPKLTALIAFLTLKCKIDCSDTIHIMDYYPLTQNKAASNRTKLLTLAVLQNYSPYSTFFYNKINALKANHDINEECERISLLGEIVDTIFWSGNESINELNFYKLIIYSIQFQNIHRNTPAQKKIAILKQLINCHPLSNITTDQNSKLFLEKVSIKALESLCNEGIPLACQLTLEGIDKYIADVEALSVDEKLHIAEDMSETGIIELETLIRQKSLIGNFDQHKVLNAFYRSKNRMMIEENMAKKDKAVVLLNEKLSEIDNKLSALSLEKYLTSSLHQRKWDILVQAGKKKYLVKLPIINKPISYDTILNTVLQNNVQVIDIMTNDSLLFVMSINKNTLDLKKIKVDSLDKLLFRQFKDAISDKNSAIDFIKTTGSILFKKYLIHSIDTTVKNIVFCPMGFTHNLPFAALIDQGGYLIKKYSVSIISNISELMTWKVERLPVRSISAFAFSDQKTLKSEATLSVENLPNAIAEMRVIEKLPIQMKKMLHGYDLTKQAIIPYLKADILHFATHAYSDVFNRNMNYLLLYKNKDLFNRLFDNSQSIDSLYGYEIEHSPIKARLIILNACETNLGAEYSGYGVYSITTSFLKTKVNNLLSTTHRIDDDHAVNFIKHFYDQLSTDQYIGLALQKTQAMSSDMHPYYWAAYQCYGNLMNQYSFQ